MIILGIDPGPTESAYAILSVNNLELLEFGKVNNEMLLNMITYKTSRYLYAKVCFAIEMVASYGMPVGKEVFETVFWTGRFWESSRNLDVFHKEKIYRKEETMNLCHSMKAKDGNIRQALIDRFGPVGTKKNQGWFYGVSKDVWAAIAVGVTYHDIYIKPK